MINLRNYKIVIVVKLFSLINKKNNINAYIKQLWYPDALCDSVDPRDQ